MMWVDWGSLEPTSTPFTVTVLWAILPAGRRHTEVRSGDSVRCELAKDPMRGYTA